MQPIARLAACLAILAGATGAAAAPESADEAPAAAAEEPQADDLPAEGEAWGDEWFDSAEAARAKAIQAEMLREAAAEERREETQPRQPQQAAPQPSGRSVVPPRWGLADLDAAWRERRLALLRQDASTAAAAERRFRAILEELDLREAHAFAAAVVRESRKLEASDPEEALARAALAVSLAPSLPVTHLQHLRAALAHDPLAVGRLASIAWEAVRAGLADERTLRLLVLDLAAAGMGAHLVAGLLALLFLALRHGRSLLHDFHHLFPRGASPLQSATLLLLLLALPMAVGAGPLVFGALVLALIRIYLGRRERAMMAAWLVLATWIPAASGVLAHWLSWEGTRAAELFAVERAGDFSVLPALEARAEGAGADPATLFATARAVKRLGRLDEAAALYGRALEMRPRWAEAELNLGNVLLLQGDLDGAERRYARAIDLEPGLALAYFNLSRVHYGRLDLALGQAARSRAIELDPSLVEQYAATERGAAPANRYVLDASLSDADLAAAASVSGEARRLETQLATALLRPLPVAWASPAGLAFVLLVALAGHLLLQRIRPARSCSRCGRAVCCACNPETRDGNLCGQCVHVFAAGSLVNLAARERKERAARAYRIRLDLWQRLGALLLVGPLLAGKPVRGALLTFCGWTLALLLLVPSGLARPLWEGLPTSWKPLFLLPPLLLLLVLSWRQGKEAA